LECQRINSELERSKLARMKAEEAANEAQNATATLRMENEASLNSLFVHN